MSDNRIKGADSIENVAVQKGATVAAALGLSVMKTSGKTVTSTAAPVSLTYNEGGSVTTAQMRDNYVNAAAGGRFYLEGYAVGPCDSIPETKEKVMRFD